MDYFYGWTSHMALHVSGTILLYFVHGTLCMFSTHGISIFSFRLTSQEGMAAAI
jgi:hypothetical protein